MRYDLEKLKEETDIISVASSMGMQSKGSGRAIQFLCPNPDHNDNHFGSCKLTKDGRGIICYACLSANGKHKTWDAVSLLTECFGYDFKEACQYLAEFSGMPERYYIGQKKDRTAKKKLFLTKSEMEYLGINKGTKVFLPVDAFSKEVFPLPAGQTCERRVLYRNEEEVSEYVAYERGDLPQNEKAFREIVLNKVREKIFFFHEMLEEIQYPSFGRYAYLHEFQKRSGYSNEFMMEMFNREIDFGLEIYKRFGEEKSSVKRASLIDKIPKDYIKYLEMLKKASE